MMQPQEDKPRLVNRDIPRVKLDKNGKPLPRNRKIYHDRMEQKLIDEYNFKKEYISMSPRPSRR